MEGREEPHWNQHLYTVHCTVHIEDSVQRTREGREEPHQNQLLNRTFRVFNSRPGREKIPTVQYVESAVAAVLHCFAAITVRFAREGHPLLVQGEEGTASLDFSNSKEQRCVHS